MSDSTAHETEEEPVDDDQEQEEEVLEPKILPKRTTRAQRSSAAAEGDDEFWQQEAFQEEGADDDYQQEQVSADEPDSDFFESEQEESDEDEEGNLAKEKTKKRQGYVDPQRRKRGGTAAASRAAKRAKTETTSSTDAMETESSTPLTSAELSMAVPEAAPPRSRARKSTSSPSTVTPQRKSRRSTTLEKSSATRQRSEIARSEPRVKRDKIVVRIRSQAELLAEAARTEVWNTESLRQMLLQEEDKKRVLAVRARYDGPAIVSLSTQRHHGISIEAITFTKIDRVPGRWNQPRPLPHLGTRLCPVNNAPPKYMDPITQIPFDSIQTFHTIRTNTGAYQQLYTEQTQRLQNQRMIELNQEYQILAHQNQLDAHARITLREQRIREGKITMQAMEDKKAAGRAAEEAHHAKLEAREQAYRQITLDSIPTFKQQQQQKQQTQTSTSTSSSSKLNVTTTDTSNQKNGGRKTPRGRK